MRLSERQCLGALVLLVVSILVYGASLLSQYRGASQLAVTWGEQAPGTIAVGVSGSRGSDGIYFFPKGISCAMVRRCVGIKGPMIQDCNADTRFSDHKALAISLEEGTVRISGLAAAKRLALGLPIDINMATEEDLNLVPGIGRNLAGLIMQLRHARGKIEALSELTTIPGIKEKKLESLKKYLEVSSSL